MEFGWGNPVSYLVFGRYFGVKEHYLAFVFVNGEAGLLKPGKYLVGRFDEFVCGGLVCRAGSKNITVVDV